MTRVFKISQNSFLVNLLIYGYIVLGVYVYRDERFDSTHPKESAIVMADSMTGSVEQCAVECVTVSCAAFLYDTSAMTCRQLSKPLTADIITTHPEMKAVQYYLSDIGCGEDDWTLYRKHCYRYYDIELSWDNAKTVCEGDNSSLVQLETADEASWLLSTIVPNGGRQAIVCNKARYYASICKTLKRTLENLTLKIIFNAYKYKKVKTTNNDQSIISRMSTPPSVGQTRSPGNTGDRIMCLTGYYLDQANGMIRCQYWYVKNGLTIEPVDPFNNCTWVGATDREVEGTFKWIVGYGDITSLPWYGRQPDNSHGGQDCLAVMRNAHFDDAKCADRKVFVCEKEH